MLVRGGRRDAGLGRVQLLEFPQDEPCVVVDVAADGEDGDPSVVRPDCCDVGAGEDRWLELLVLDYLDVEGIVLAYALCVGNTS